jgi:hypothetical protein
MGVEPCRRMILPAMVGRQTAPEHAKLLGIIKRRRKQHRERQELESIMWGDP